MNKLAAPPCAETPPTDAEIAAVDRGLVAALADLEAEDRDPDPFIALYQDDRDRQAARGDLTAAWDAQASIEDLRHAAAHQRQADELEVEA